MSLLSFFDRPPMRRRLVRVGHIALTCWLVIVFTGPAQSQVQEYKLTASDGAEDDLFGVSLSLSGDRALIGAMWDDDAGLGSGSAYVFEHQIDGSWIETAKLTASDGAEGRWFGRNVSVAGMHALVGAHLDDQLGSDSGSAYVFEQQDDSSWFEAAKLNASDGAEGDHFGYSVSLSREGRALVGANRDHGYAGSAYVFERQIDGSWIEMAKLNASDGAEFDRFGFSVSLSGIDHALVGAYGDDDNTGSAYVFERQWDGSWLEIGKLIASDGAGNDWFGRSVSLSADLALVGAHLDDDQGMESGSAYVFERQANGSWIEVEKLNASDGAADDNFGYAVSLSPSGHALVGASGDDASTGSAYVFEQTRDGSWMEVGKFTASDGLADDYFGHSVSLSEETGAIVGAFGNSHEGILSGSAYVYENIFSTGVGMAVDSPQGYLLSPVYPNPFNLQVQFSLSVQRPQNVRIEVYDSLGRRISTLLDGQLTNQITHRFTFDTGSLPSGVYLLRVTGHTFSTTRTMTLLK